MPHCFLFDLAAQGVSTCPDRQSISLLFVVLVCLFLLFFSCMSPNEVGKSKFSKQRELVTKEQPRAELSWFVLVAVRPFNESLFVVVFFVISCETAVVASAYLTAGGNMPSGTSPNWTALLRWRVRCCSSREAQQNDQDKRLADGTAPSTTEPLASKLRPQKMEPAPERWSPSELYQLLFEIPALKHRSRRRKAPKADSDEASPRKIASPRLGRLAARYSAGPGASSPPMAISAAKWVNSSAALPTVKSLRRNAKFLASLALLGYACSTTQPSKLSILDMETGIRGGA